MATVTQKRASTAAAPTSWNLNRVLVVLGSFSVLLAGFAFAGWSLPAFAKAFVQLVPAVPGWIFAIVLAFYARPWVYLTAGILNAVLPLMVLFVFGAVASLGSPLAGGEYQSLLLLIVGLVFSLSGGIAGFVQGRKNAHTPLAGSMSSAKGMSTVLLAIFVGGMMVASGLASSAVKEMAASGGSYNVVPDETLTLATADFQFAPRTLNVPVGKLVEIQITNEDSASHTFTYHAGDKTFETFLPAGATTKVLLRFDAPQTIHFWCAPHSGGADDASEDSMNGDIVVA